jgi:hypothetical protein
MEAALLRVRRLAQPLVRLPVVRRLARHRRLPRATTLQIDPAGHPACAEPCRLRPHSLEPP